jgi:hypothetical protein
MTDLDISSLEETKIAPVFEAWQDLPEETRAHIDREFQDVHLMADELGLRTLLDEAHYHNEPLEEELANLEGFYAQAMWVLLERRSYFDVAVQFKTADELPPRYWEQRNNFPDFPPRDDHDSCDHLSGVLQAYFRAEGRGSTCEVEPYRRDDLYYFFAYLEDHAQTLMEFQNASLTNRVVRPAFDVVFVFNPKKGTLSTFYEGPRQARRGLQEIFARCLLGINLPDQPKDERIYNLDQLKNRGFDFVIDPRMGVQGLGLVQIKFSLPGSRKPRGRSRWTQAGTPRQSTTSWSACSPRGRVRATVFPWPWPQCSVW